MEETIIDGIDVSGCIWLNETHPRLDFSGCGHVCDGHECAYKREYLIKQLKQKEKECEELKKQINIYQKMIENRDFKIVKILQIISEVEE